MTFIKYGIAWAILSACTSVMVYAGISFITLNLWLTEEQALWWRALTVMLAIGWIPITLIAADKK